MNIQTKKILFCTPFDISTGSGIARWAHHIYEFYTNIESKNISLDIYPMDRTIYLDETANFFKRVYLGIMDYSKIVKGICTKILQEKYDIVHIASSASISLVKDLYLLRKLQHYGVHTIIHFHFGRIPELYASNNWEWKLISKVAELSAKIIVIDKSSYDSLLNAGIRNVYLLPNPLTPQIEDIVSNNQPISRKSNSILFVGHVYKTKGVYELFEACSQIPNIHLKIIGKYDDRVKKELLEISSKNNSDSRIVFTGNIRFDEVVKEMMECSIFVLPTYTEGFPNVILESMACGCPIITTNVGAIPEMLDITNGNENGICVSPKNVEELKSAILFMLNNNSYAIQCGKNAQKRVYKMYSIQRIWEEMCCIWQV